MLLPHKRPARHFLLKNTGNNSDEGGHRQASMQHVGWRGAAGHFNRVMKVVTNDGEMTPIFKKKGHLSGQGHTHDHTLQKVWRIPKDPTEAQQHTPSPKKDLFFERVGPASHAALCWVQQVSMGPRGVRGGMNLVVVVKAKWPRNGGAGMPQNGKWVI